MSPYLNTRRTPLSTNLQPPHDSSTQWRCPHKRLHLDSQDCFPISPDSPIIDTPSKYRKMQARRNAALLLNDSQATQPTFSGPQQAGKHHDTPEESLASAHSLQHHGDDFGKEQGQNVDESQDFLVPSSPPSYHGFQRVPETPFADLPSSPPLPLLTSANLRQLNSLPTREAPSSRNHASLPAASPAPSVRSLPSEVAHRISRLVLRTKINAAKHEASEEQLEATRGALSVALARVQIEVSRANNWMAITVALLLLCLAYAAWCQHNSAEFAFIEESRRKWFGLL